jgi:hypothetical protein
MEFERFHRLQVVFGTFADPEPEPAAESILREDGVQAVRKGASPLMNQTAYARQGKGMLDWLVGASVSTDEEVRSSKSVCIYL